MLVTTKTSVKDTRNLHTPRGQLNETLRGDLDAISRISKMALNDKFTSLTSNQFLETARHEACSQLNNLPTPLKLQQP